MNDIEAWNTSAVIYDKRQADKGDPLHQFMIDPAISRLLGRTTNKTILDAGCGNGYWVRRLAKNAKRVIGIDAAREMVAIAETKNKQKNTEFLNASLTGPLPFAKNYFDIILSCMVFQYLPRIDMAASEFYRILRTKGKVVIALQHPIYQYHFRAQAKAGLISGAFPKTVGYFDRSAVKQKVMSGKIEVRIYNRPLEDYLKCFFDAGFALTNYSEPEYPKSLLIKERRYRDTSEVPRVAILEFSKR